MSLSRTYGPHLLNMEVIRVDIQTITSIIGSLGFPIAACIAMFSMLNKERDEHKAEMAEITKAIQNNTLALEALKGQLNRDE